MSEERAQTQTTDTAPGFVARLSESLEIRLAGAFRAAGEELYLVGGAVRDRLMGRDDFDLDFATSARPEETARILEALSLGQPYRVGEKFGTICLRVGERSVEITTYRSEAYAPGSRKPSVRFGRSLMDDLARRDFTINAMALDPLSGQLLDPLGGRQDLQGRTVRAVGSPEQRFSEDPLRILRSIRIASLLGFDIEPGTWDGVRRQSAALRLISHERIRDEYSKMLEGRDPVRALELLRDGSLFDSSVPQLVQLTLMPDHGPKHPLSLWDHTMRVVAAVPRALILRWAALLHDIAKPATRTHEPSGRPRFFHHEEVGARLARCILGGLRYSNQVINDVALLIETHMQLHAYSPEWSEGAIRRLMLRLGPLMGDAILLARADAAGHVLAGPAANAPKFDDLEERILRLGEITPRLQSPLSGDDLMERYGRPPGPWIRGIKEVLLNEVVEGRLGPEDQETAWGIADDLVRAGA